MCKVKLLFIILLSFVLIKYGNSTEIDKIFIDENNIPYKAYRIDQNNDGYEETIAFKKKDQPFPFIQFIDYSKDRKTDYFIIGKGYKDEIEAVELNRINWPIIKESGTTYLAKIKKARFTNLLEFK